MTDAFSDDALLLAAEAGRVLGEVAPVEPTVRFLRSVAVAFRSLDADQVPAGSEVVAVFCRMVESVSAFAGRETIERVYPINWASEGAGRVWLCSENLGYARGRELPAGDWDLLEWARQSPEWSSLQTVVVHRIDGKTSAVHYPFGLNSPHQVDVDIFRTFDLSDDVLVEHVERVYQTLLRTPNLQVRGAQLWVDSVRGWPCAEPEGVVQSALAAGLAGALLEHRIETEFNCRGGKCDIVVISVGENGLGNTYHFAIELKVTRSKSSTGSLKSDNWNDKWLRKGARQARRYQKQIPATRGVLFAFDMRLDPLPDPPFFDSVRSQPKNHALLLRHWQIFNTLDAPDLITEPA